MIAGEAVICSLLGTLNIFLMMKSFCFIYWFPPEPITPVLLGPLPPPFVLSLAALSNSSSKYPGLYNEIQFLLDLLIIVGVVYICYRIVVHYVTAIMRDFNARIMMGRSRMKYQVHATLFQATISLDLHVTLFTVNFSIFSSSEYQALLTSG